MPQTHRGDLSFKAKQTASELGQNVSSVLNKTGENVHSTLRELGHNVSNVSSDILNKTEEAGKKVGIGAADVLSNISGEIKQGLNAK
jgi:methyl-accepting chemotaxis protein